MQPMSGYGGGPPGYGGPPSYGGGPPGYGGGGPPSYGGGPPSGGGGARSYEFNQAENLTIANVAKYASRWGIISLISGILVLLTGIIVTVAAGAVAGAMASSGAGRNSAFGPAVLGALGVALIPTALVSIIGGVFYMKSGKALQAVVDTQGNDIPMLTNAVRSLATAFKIEAIAMAVGFVVGLIIGIVGRAGGHQ